MAASYWGFVISVLITYLETPWKCCYVLFCEKWHRKDSQLVVLVPKLKRSEKCSFSPEKTSLHAMKKSVADSVVTNLPCQIPCMKSLLWDLYQ